MKNLKLLQRLQASEMVTLILRTTPGDVLEYFIVARTINYSILANGKCDGDIRAPMRTFNILLSGLMPMIEKGYDFRIKYEDETLTFVSKDERLTLSPLCVEFHDEQAAAIIQKYQRFSEAAGADEKLKNNEEKLEREIAQLQDSYQGSKLLHLEGAMQSSDPFSEDVVDKKIDQKFVPLIAEKKQELTKLQQMARGLKAVSLNAFKTIILAAARVHEIVNFCGEYAIMELKTSYLIQKDECPVMAVQGQLLNHLMQYGEGEGFYWFENSLMFVSGDKERTVVFLEKYLPNTKVDSTIVTNGAVLEKYNLSMKGVLKVTQLMRSKFPDMTLDMGAPLIILGNDRGEKLNIKFEVSDADTLEMRRMMKQMQEAAATGKMAKPVTVTMAKLSIPAEVQSLLGVFKDQLTICVKQRKVIFQSGRLYLVFGR